MSDDSNIPIDPPVMRPEVTTQEWLKEFLYSKTFASLVLTGLTVWLGPDGAKWAGLSVQAAQELIPVMVTLFLGFGLAGRASTAIKTVQLKKTQEALIVASQANSALGGKVDALTDAHREAVTAAALVIPAQEAK